MTPEQLAEMQQLIRRAISDPGSILPRADESVSSWGMRAVLAEIEAHPVLEIRPYYPTQDAYDATCRALEKHRQRADDAEAEVERLTAQAAAMAEENTRLVAEVERLKRKAPGSYYWWQRVRDAHGAPHEDPERCAMCGVLYGGEAL